MKKRKIIRVKLIPSEDKGLTIDDIENRIIIDDGMKVDITLWYHTHRRLINDCVCFKDISIYDLKDRWNHFDQENKFHIYNYSVSLCKNDEIITHNILSSGETFMRNILFSQNISNNKIYRNVLNDIISDSIRAITKNGITPYFPVCMKVDLEDGSHGYIIKHKYDDDE